MHGHVGNALITLCASFSLMNVAEMQTDGTSGFITEAKDSRAHLDKTTVRNIHSARYAPCNTEWKIKVPPRELQSSLADFIIFVHLLFHILYQSLRNVLIYVSASRADCIELDAYRADTIKFSIWERKRGNCSATSPLRRFATAN